MSINWVCRALLPADKLRDLVMRLGERLRRRKLVVGLTLLSVALAPLFWWGLMMALEAPYAVFSRLVPRTDLPAAPVTGPPAQQQEDLHHLTAVVQPGCNVYSLLLKAGVSHKDVVRLIEDFAEAADLTRCKPGESFTIDQRPDGSIASISYQKGPLEVYRAARQAQAWQVTRESIPYVTRIGLVSGTVESSLFEAMAAAGEKDALTISLIEILSWEIDFTHESQPGDRFALLVEKYFLNGTPVGYGPILAAEYVLPTRVIQGYALKVAAGRMEYFNEAGLSMRKSFLKSPLRYSRITSGFTSHRLHPITGRVQPHYAIDYAAPTGTPVWSVADGAVRTVGYDAAAGRHVSVAHPGGYESWYLHLSGFARGLKVGQRVQQQQVIGYVGATGLATGPHLDYRLRRNGGLVNPLKEEFPRTEPVPLERRTEFQERVAWLKPLLSPLSPAESFPLASRR